MARLHPEDFEFLLKPWEYVGGPFNSCPDFVVTKEVKGQSRVFLLKIRDNRIFFRWPGPTRAEWALTTLTPADESDPVGFWHSQIKIGNFGRYQVIERGFDAILSPEELVRFSGSGLATSTIFPTKILPRTVVSFIIRADGAVWACEWCGETWLEFPPEPGLVAPNQDGIWDAANQLHGLRHRMPEVGKALFLGPPPKISVNQSKPEVTWTRGSESELREVFRWWYMAVGKRPEIGCEYPPAIALPPRKNHPIAIRSGLPVFADNPRHQRIWGLYHLDGKRYFQPPAEILQWFAPVCLTWKLTGVGTRRGDFTFEKHIIKIPFDPPIWNESDRAEALCNLGQWFKGKVAHNVRKQIMSQFRP